MTVGVDLVGPRRELDHHGPTAAEGKRLVRRVRVWLALGLTLANLAGIAVVVACVIWVIPGPPVERLGRLVALNIIVALAFCLVAVPSILAWGRPGSGRVDGGSGKDVTPNRAR